MRTVPVELYLDGLGRDDDHFATVSLFLVSPCNADSCGYQPCQQEPKLFIAPLTLHISLKSWQIKMWLKHHYFSFPSNGNKQKQTPPYPPEAWRS